MLALGLANGSAGSPSGGKGYASPRRHRSPGAPSAVGSPGAAWQDGGAKPAAAELRVSLPARRSWPRAVPPAARGAAAP